MEKSSNITLEKIEIKDIIDISLLQKFQDDFAMAMNCASVTVDREGNPVTDPSSYTRFCDGFIHSTTTGDNSCAISHKRMGEEAAKSGKPFVGFCHAGLIDFAAPIIVEGELIGTVLGGQMLSKKPDEENFREVAKKVEVDPDGLVDAVQEIGIVTKEQIEKAANVLFIVVNALAKNGYNKIKLDNVTNNLANNFDKVSDAVQELSDSSVNIISNQEELNNEINEIVVITEQINGILNSIQAIANQTKLLGLNASIEASRVGESGKGFSVVANEIRKLAENSKNTTLSISTLIDKIKGSVNRTVNNSKTTLENTRNQSGSVQEVESSIQDSISIVSELNEMTKKL